MYDVKDAQCIFLFGFRTQVRMVHSIPAQRQATLGFRRPLNGR